SALIPRLRAHHVRAITRGRINAPTSLTTGLGVAYRTCDRRAHLRARAPSARRRPEFDSRAFGATHEVEEVALRAASHVLVALVLEVLGERDGLEGVALVSIEEELWIGEVDVELRDVVGAGVNQRLGDG